MIGAIVAVVFVALFGGGVIIMFILAHRHSVRFTRRGSVDWTGRRDQRPEADPLPSDLGWVAGLAALPAMLGQGDADQAPADGGMPSDGDDRAHRSDGNISHGGWVSNGAHSSGSGSQHHGSGSSTHSHDSHSSHHWGDSGAHSSGHESGGSYSSSSDFGSSDSGSSYSSSSDSGSSDSGSSSSSSYD